MDKLITAAVITAFTFAFCAIIVFLTYLTEGIPCGTRAKKMGFDHTWGPLEGCMVNVRGQWVPLENYKVLE